MNMHTQVGMFRQYAAFAALALGLLAAGPAAALTDCTQARDDRPNARPGQTVFKLLLEGFSQRDIARVEDRHPAVISRRVRNLQKLCRERLLE